MFSCCCAYSDRFFGADPVCDCYGGICPITQTNETDVPFRSRGDDFVCCESCASTYVQSNSSLSYYRFAQVREAERRRRSTWCDILCAFACIMQVGLGAQDIYEQVRATYPNASIWFTGHSLGGSLSSLLAQTYGHPAFGYNSPGTHKGLGCSDHGDTADEQRRLSP